MHVHVAAREFVRTHLGVCGGGDHGIRVRVRVRARLATQLTVPTHSAGDQSARPQREAAAEAHTHTHTTLVARDKDCGFVYGRTGIGRFRGTRPLTNMGYMPNIFHTHQR